LAGIIAQRPTVAAGEKRDRLRSLYICYLSLEDPLVETQVVAYLEGLAQRGHVIHLLTFDGKLSPARRSELQEALRARGITWHSRRYHKRLSLAATVYDALAGAVTAALLVRRHRLNALHARNHVPGVMAMIVRRFSGCRLIFDLRGLMAEEYADAGRWRRGGLAYRITKRAEHAAIARADAMVVLTRRVRAHLFGATRPDWLEVIPCCADVERLAAAAGERERTRAELGVADRPVLIYVGKFGGWYMEREMVDFFATALETIPGLVFLVLTQEDPGAIRAEFDRAGVPPSDYLVRSVPAAEVGRYLAASDLGISLIRPCLSKISSSPTKIGEYLVAGLPVVSSAGIGDVDELLADGAGVLVERFGVEHYRAGAEAALALMNNGSTAELCREVAERELSLAKIGIPRYDELYRRVANGERS
jgi:glycosyltransferase involved in cell wall biosynthesis